MIPNTVRFLINTLLGVSLGLRGTQHSKLMDMNASEIDVGTHLNRWVSTFILNREINRSSAVSSFLSAMTYYLYAREVSLIHYGALQVMIARTSRVAYGAYHESFQLPYDLSSPNLFCDELGMSIRR